MPTATAEETVDSDDGRPVRPFYRFVMCVLVCQAVTIALGKMCGWLWAHELGTSAGRLGFGSFDPGDYPLTFVTVIVGMVFGVVAGYGQFDRTAVKVAVLLVVALAVTGVAWTAREARQAKLGEPVWTWLTPAPLSAHHISHLRLRDGRDLAVDGTLRLLARHADEFVLYDTATRRVVGVSKEDYR